MSAERVRVLDARGRELSPCEAARAARLVAAGQATWLAAVPPAIQLLYEVSLPERQRGQGPAVTPGTRLLLHICCGPCATYPVPHLREQGFDVLGWWHNPNIQPAEEHARREESARRYAGLAGLSLASASYEPERFEEAVGARTARPERCRRCYRLRLGAAARAAHERGIEVVSTTLLISPYQDQAAIREIGEEAARRQGVRFHYENLRRGWPERSRLARQYGLYRQPYCGCRFSLAERLEARRSRLVPARKEVP